MKRLLVALLFLVLLAGLLSAHEKQYADSKPGLKPHPGYSKASNLISDRDSIRYTFSTTPIPLMTSYWDYMIGAYGGLPVRVRQDSLRYTHLVFMGQRAASGTRRVFYAVMGENGSILYNNEVTADQIDEGHITCTLDAVSKKPLFSWHSDIDSDTPYENLFSFDALLLDIPGIVADPDTIVNNPTTVGSTTDNDFDWPVTMSGPSPLPGQRRVYTFSDNSVSHCALDNPAENVLIGHADFTGTQLEDGLNNLTWAFGTIPTLDRWNNDPAVWRRFFHAPCIGRNGNVYLVGHTTGKLADNTTLLDDSLCVFMNTNYGEGPWQMFSMYPNIEYPAPDTTGFVYCRVSSSAHNTAVENLDGTISYPIVVAWYSLDDTWYPFNQTLQEVIFNPANGSFTLKDLYPTGVYPNNGVPVFPWDMNEDGIQDTDNNGNNISFDSWPYMYWDSTVADNGMMFHYASLRMTEVNAHGMKAMVWSESVKAKLFNTYPNDYPELAPYSGVPEVFISVYPVDGLDGPHWSEPIALNSIIAPELAGMIPEWAYPGDYIEYLGINELGTKIGRMRMMFFDDNTWGASSMSPPVGQHDGGRVMFTTLDIAFGPGTLTGNEDPVENPATMPLTLHQNYPNPFNPSTTISFTLKQPAAIELRVYNLKGQLVKKLMNAAKPAGSHAIIWDGTDDKGRKVSSGIYTYKVTNGKFSSSKKMILMK